MKKSKMLLNAFLWLALYIVLQLIATICYLTYYLLINADKLINILKTQSYEKLIDYLMSSKIIIPSLLISDILSIIICFAIIKKKNPGVIKKITLSNILYYLSLGVMLNYIISFAISFIPKGILLNYQSHMNVLEGNNLLLNLIVVGVLTPIVEEIIFRYGITGNLVKINNKMGIIIGSLLFGLMHGQPIQICYAFLLGLILSEVYIRTNNIWYSCFIHIGINSSSTMITEKHINNIATLIIVTLILISYFFINQVKIRRKNI